VWRAGQRARAGERRRGRSPNPRPGVMCARVSERERGWGRTLSPVSVPLGWWRAPTSTSRCRAAPPTASCATQPLQRARVRRASKQRAVGVCLPRHGRTHSVAARHQLRPRPAHAARRQAGSAGEADAPRGRCAAPAAWRRERAAWLRETRAGARAQRRAHASGRTRCRVCSRRRGEAPRARTPLRNGKGSGRGEVAGTRMHRVVPIGLSARAARRAHFPSTFRRRFFTQLPQPRAAAP
jgi:hypothetical protein